MRHPCPRLCPQLRARSEEHTSELQSHSEISYAVFCLKKKKPKQGRCKDLWKTKLKFLRFSLFCTVFFFRLIPVNLLLFFFSFFFFNDTATTEIYTNLNTLSLHDALPISSHIQKSRMPSSACDW